MQRGTEKPFRMRISAAMYRAAIAMTVCAATLAPNASASASVEYSVKAAYLAKFGIFVQWPKTSFDTPQSPVVLCVVGSDPFGDVLDKSVEGQHVGERPLVIRRLKTVSRDSGCTILFAGGSEAQSVDQALATVSGTGVLTVTDNARDGHIDAVVDFVVQDGRVRFTIDDHAAAQNGIVVSSHLLSLALSVKPRS
jgi:hypothetical protein